MKDLDINMKDYEKLWFQLKTILTNDETRHAKLVIETMTKLESIQPIAVFSKSKDEVKGNESKGIGKFFKRK